jgi:acetyl esterase/lipase
MPAFHSVFSRLAALGAALAASPLALINSLVPVRTHTVQRDLACGNDPRQQLGVYTPAGPAPGTKTPVVTVFYGGSWDSGRRSDYLLVGEAFASQGLPP